MRPIGTAASPAALMRRKRRRRSPAPLLLLDMMGSPVLEDSPGCNAAWPRALRHAMGVPDHAGLTGFVPQTADKFSGRELRRVLRPIEAALGSSPVITRSAPA